MFTGIIEHLGRVTEARRRGGLTVLTVSVEPPVAGVTVGESIALDGVCLTVTGVSGDGLSFDVVPATLARTTLGRRRPGDLVNLERSLRLGELVGGHFVLGHVDGVGRVAALRPVGGEVEMEVEVPPELTGQMLPQGSIAVDGISLTLVAVEAGRFTVALIPHTREHTNLREKQVGDLVNIETDCLGKWVLRGVAERTGGGVTRELLERTGFAGPASADEESR
jgi:riboflavin synthase